MDRPFDVFCSAVCAQVRAGHARKAITAELTAHLEDHAQALTAGGLDPDAAAREAVKAMGDPAELGKSLDRLHSPWPAILSHITWAMACLALCVALFAAFLFRVELQARRPTEQLSFDREAPEIASSLLRGNPESAAIICPGGNTVQVRDYTLRATRSMLTSSQKVHTLYFELSAQWRDPWLGPPAFPGGFSALDSTGRVYLPHDGSLAADYMSSVDVYGSTEPSGLYSCAATGRVFQVSADAAWVDLRYDHGGVSFTLRIPLEGGTPYDG